MKEFLKKINIDPKIIDYFDTADKSALESFKRLKLLYQTYQNHNISDNIFKASIHNYERRLLDNYKSFQKLTLIQKDMKWVNMILDFKIFKLGSLRFQLFPMDYKEIERDSFDWMPLDTEIKKVFYEGRPLINVHIEKDTDLSESAVEESFNIARRFFIEVFPDIHFDGFVTRTWLIYPGIVELLKPTSNIYKFANRFTIIASNNASYQALERVYGTQDLSKIQKLPKNSSLEKTIYKNLNKLGVGFGFLPF